MYLSSWIAWALLAGAAVVFWLIPRAARIGYLALVSFACLIYFAPKFDNLRPQDAWRSQLFLAAWALLFFFLAPKAAKTGPRRFIVPGLILAILAYLAYFKYIPSILSAFAKSPADRILIPLGISYFTFKLIHYAVEVGRGNIKDRSLPAFLCYIFLFPIFTAGPIERFDHFLASREKELKLANITQGLLRIIHGLIKKFVILELLFAMFYNPSDIGWMVRNTHNVGPPTLWRFMILSYLAMYLDFSAYSDVAIGASRLFGFPIQENFNWPILAPNVPDFWKRWHITLANWCMAYVYMPLLGLWRNPYIAAYATFLVMGLWHAGSWPWVLWGIYQATGLVVAQSWMRYRKRKKWKFFDHPGMRILGIYITFPFITVSFVFSSIHGHGTAHDCLRVLAKMFYINLP